MSSGNTLAELVAVGVNAFDTQAPAWNPAAWFEQLRAATIAQPSGFPPRILAVLQEIAKREGPGFDGAWTDDQGEPLQDDADAALSWIAAYSPPAKGETCRTTPLPAVAIAEGMERDGDSLEQSE